MTNIDCYSSLSSASSLAVTTTFLLISSKLLFQFSCSFLYVSSLSSAWLSNKKLRLVVGLVGVEAWLVLFSMSKGKVRLLLEIWVLEIGVRVGQVKLSMAEVAGKMVVFPVVFTTAEVQLGMVLLLCVQVALLLEIEELFMELNVLVCAERASLVLHV